MVIHGDIKCVGAVRYKVSALHMIHDWNGMARDLFFASQHLVLSRIPYACACTVCMCAIQGVHTDRND